MPSRSEKKKKAIIELPPWAEEKKKAMKKGRKKRKARRHLIDSFILKDLSNPERLRLFYDVYAEDFREQVKKRQPLTPKDWSRVERLARAIIESEGKQVFVATIRKRKGRRNIDVPIGYIIFWISPSGLKYYCDRIFIRDKYREMGYGSRITLRSLGRAFLEHPGIEFAVYKDAILYPTENLLNVLKQKGFIKRFEQTAGDYLTYLDRDVLVKEAEIIRAYERWKSSSLWKKFSRKRKLLKLRKEYYDAWAKKTEKPKSKRRRR